MNKLFIFLLFISFNSFGQSQIINGIELNSPKEMVKVGNLTWEDEKNSLTVIPLKQISTKKQKETAVKRGNRYLELIFSHNVESLGESNHIAIFKSLEKVGNITLFQGQVMIQQGDYEYLIVSTSISSGGKNEDENAIATIHRILGYMMAKIIDPIYVN